MSPISSPYKREEGNNIEAGASVSQATSPLPPSAGGEGGGGGQKIQPLTPNTQDPTPSSGPRTPDPVPRTTAFQKYIPEAVTVLLLIIAFIVSVVREPRFLDVAYLFDRSTLYMEAGLMALAMTLVIVAGHIDLSCTAILALVGAIITTLNAMGVPFVVLIPLAPVIGGILGWFNGVLVAWRGLPSLVVTLATMALYRGIAQILLGDHSLAVPPQFAGIDRVTIPGTYIHVPMLLFLAASVGFGLVLHRTVFGRFTTATGINPEAARYAGIPVPRLVTTLFVISGAMAGLAAVLLLSRLGVARFDHARGLELDVITAVVLGGASIQGGRGTIFGTVAALLLVAVVQTGMGVAGVKAEVQVTIIGLLLIASVLLTHLLGKISKRG